MKIGILFKYHLGNGLKLKMINLNLVLMRLKLFQQDTASYLRYCVEDGSFDTYFCETNYTSIISTRMRTTSTTTTTTLGNIICECPCILAHEYNLQNTAS